MNTPPDIFTHALPSSIAPRSLAGRTAVVIDVLRATTTIVQALASGARQVIPCATIDEARAAAARFAAGQALLGGERGGLAIEGFDLGNSPREYTRAVVEGKTLVLTTTNGTRALVHCRDAQEILVASFANLSAVAARLAGCRQIDLVCAGTDGRPTEEDLLLAGAIADRLDELLTGAVERRVDDETAAARRNWKRLAAGATCSLTGRLATALRSSLGGRNLVAVGMGDDIAGAARIDTCHVVPRFDSAAGAIRISPPEGDA